MQCLPKEIKLELLKFIDLRAHCILPRELLDAYYYIPDDSLEIAPHCHLEVEGKCRLCPNFSQCAWYENPHRDGLAEYAAETGSLKLLKQVYTAEKLPEIPAGALDHPLVVRWLQKHSRHLPALIDVIMKASLSGLTSSYNEKDFKNTNVIMKLIRRGNLPLIKALSMHYFDDEYSLLRYEIHRTDIVHAYIRNAARAGSVDILKLLLPHCNPETIIVDTSSVECYKWLTENKFIVVPGEDNADLLKYLERQNVKIPYMDFGDIGSCPESIVRLALKRTDTEAVYHLVLANRIPLIPINDLSMTFALRNGLTTLVDYLHGCGIKSDGVIKLPCVGGIPFREEAERAYIMSLNKYSAHIPIRLAASHPELFVVRSQEILDYLCIHDTITQNLFDYGATLHPSRVGRLSTDI